MGVSFRMIWDTEALNDFRLIYYWYKTNRSLTAASKFKTNIENTVILLQKNPLLGERDRHLSHRKKEYRSLLSFPHHRIVYYVENTTIYIMSIRDNRMGSKQ